MSSPPVSAGKPPASLAAALNVPNLLTISRILLVPLLVVVLFGRTQGFAAHHEYLVLPQLAAFVATGVTSAAP